MYVDLWCLTPLPTIFQLYPGGISSMYVINVRNPMQKTERSCICLLGLSIVPLSMIFSYWILELFRQCGNFFF